jgi:AmmeMemoRadiSam system protein B
MSDRQTYFSGSFYPGSAEEIEQYIEAFDKIKTEHLGLHPKALIVPHAGYVYSGFTANLAFMQADTPKRVIIIGPSHRVAFNGISISLHERYNTPLGDLAIDTAYAQSLKAAFGLAHEPAMHKEHSTEVQMPFIKHYFPDTTVVEMVYGNQDPTALAAIIETLLDDPDTLIVISTDLSHFYTEDVAHELDELCLQAIDTEDVSLLHRGCEACGKIGVEAVLMAAKKKGLATKVLDYRTSAWASGDTSRVVGYTSALIY